MVRVYKIELKVYPYHNVGIADSSDFVHVVAPSDGVELCVHFVQQYQCLRC